MSDLDASSLPPDRSARLRPGVGWYWIGGVILVVGVAVGFVWLITTAIAAATRSDQFERIPVPGERRLEFTQAGSFTFYAETAQPVSYDETLVEPDVEVRTLDGRRIGTNISTSTETYSVNGRHGQSFATVNIPSAGVYEVVVTAGQGTGVRPLRVAVGKSFGMDDARGLIGGILVMGVAFFVGLIVLIVTAVKRGRAKRALGPPPGPPPGAPPFGGAYPPPAGWGGPPPYASPPPGPYGAPPAWPPPPPSGPPAPPPPPSGPPAPPPPPAPTWPPGPPPPS